VPEKYHKRRDSGEPFPFWSGTISFGLVSVPVDLYSSVRTHRVPMRMLSSKGVPLKRKYFCSVENIQLTPKEVVRGFEQDDGSFVTVTDEELEKLAPRKSRDIDLRLFVDRNAIPVGLYQRPYVLAPGGESTKAYHLLAQTMEGMNLAGIATFVMRGKEYLAAITAEEGILRATTLHFSDEIRTPDAIGLPDIEKAPDTIRKSAQNALSSLEKEEIDPFLFIDRTAADLIELATAKQEESRDVIEVSAEVDTAEADDDGDNVVDIMSLLRKRMDGKGGASSESKQPKEQPVEPPEDRSKRSATSDDDDDLTSASKQELYDKASEMEIAGRSTMSKDQLLAAIRKTR
jgi:DNA end-binding protein Ku